MFVLVDVFSIPIARFKLFFLMVKLYHTIFWVAHSEIESISLSTLSASLTGALTSFPTSSATMFIASDTFPDLNYDVSKLLFNKLLSPTVHTEPIPT